MIKSLTNQKLYGLVAGLMSLLLMAFVATPAQAQMDDGELPKVDVGGAVSSDAQAIIVEDYDSDGPAGQDGYTETTSLGFNRVAAQIQANVQFSENVSGYVELSAEPEENPDFTKFTTNIDFVYVNVNVAENLMVQAGTPGIGTANFPRWSDGALVQGNPLVGNSLAFPGTAGNGGVKLIGSYPAFGFDLTLTRGFGGGQDVSSNADDIVRDGSGIDIYGKARYTGSDLFNLGAGAAFHTGSKGLSVAAGDGDYYNVPSEIISTASGVSSRPGFSNSPTLPSDIIFNVDGEVMAGPFSANALLGYATESAETDSGTDDAAIFGELGAKYDVNDSFFVAGRFSTMSDQTDYDSDPEQTLMSRFALGAGYTYEAAMLKLEYANQSQATDPADTDAGDDGTFAFANQDHNWQAITAQFSVAF
ncbi:MAG: hypothetical protein BRD55_02935 [Bacteroidetes bacterium SW_9_63_38]|nr:MAG: hypothetical protein BRD55_02935 [Bacteroidetes bacterium SW_9_63_38]